MTGKEIGGFAFVVGYTLMLVGAIKAFGFRRVMTFFLGIFLLGIAIAMGSLRGIPGRRY